MNMNEIWGDILGKVKNSYKDAIKIANTDGVTQTCAGAMRITTEGLVKLFYLKFYRRIYNRNFRFYKAIKSYDFKRHFSPEEWEKINLTRAVGNEQLHFMLGDKDSDEDILKNFKGAVQAIQNKLEINIMSDVPAEDKPNGPVLETQSKSPIKNPADSNIKGIVQRGEEFHVQTNAALLNLLLGTNYKAWMKCWIYLTKDPDYQLVMLPEGKVINGWTNTFEEPSGIFREDFVGTRDEKLPSHEGLPTTYRAIFMKSGDGENRYYVFRGVYELSRESVPNHRISKRIDDKEDFSKYRAPHKPYHKL